MYQSGFSGDGGPGTSADLKEPFVVVVDGGNNLLIADTHNHRIRRVASGTGTITTVAGTGTSGFSGDGGPAMSAVLAYPYVVAVDGGNNLLIADAGNNRIRRVASGTGIVTTVAWTVATFTGSLAASPLFGAPTDTPTSVSFPGGAVSMGPGQGLLFAAYSFASGRELWTLAPGAASPALAWDVLPGGTGSEPSELTTLAASVTGGAPAWLFAARAAEGTAPTLHAWSTGTPGLRCALALSTPVTSPLRPVVAAAGAFFVGTVEVADGSGDPNYDALLLLPRTALTTAALCAQGAPLPVSQPLPGVVPLSRVEHCGGKVVFLARGVGSHASPSGDVGVYWLDAAATGGADGADASFTPLPESAQPRVDSEDGLLPHPRCMAGGAVAFPGANGVVALVAPSGATTLLTSDAHDYSDASALAAVGVDGGLCFVARVWPSYALLCWTPAGGLVEARAGPAGCTPELDGYMAWMLGTPSGHVHLPCFGPDGSGPHACAYTPATRTWAVTSGLEVPYSSFTSAGDQLLFAAAPPGGKPVLYAAALLA